jgi:hypothetical protein
MDLAFDDISWIVLCLNRGWGEFLNFLDAKWFYNAKSVFLVVTATLRWLNNVSGVHLAQVSLLLIGH